MNKPVLIILIPGFPNNEEDSACLPAFQQFALSLKKNYHQFELAICAFQYPFQKKIYLWNGIKVYAFGGKNKPRLHRFLTWIKVYKQLKKLHTQRHIIGIISIWATECALVGNYFAKKNDLDHKIWIIGQDAKPGNKYIRRINPQAHQLIAMSDFLKDEFFKNYDILPLTVAENGINEFLFPSLNNNIRMYDIFGAGSLIPLKNYALFIELISEIKNQFPDIKAAIAGGGGEKENLQLLINQLNLQNTVQLLGPKSHAETLELMNQSKVFLHTSHYEGNSTVLMEALYSGCQVISTCSLSHQAVENLSVAITKEELKSQLIDALRLEHHPIKRVIFNTMDNSAKKIIGLFSKE